jgi:methyl-accepting chemotaxis protein
MLTLSRFFGSVKMTTVIAALVLCSIVTAIAVVSGAIYLNLHSRSLSDTGRQQQANLRMAATILEKNINGSVLKWSEADEVSSFQLYGLPPFYDTKLIDSVTRVTRQDATIYALDPDSQTFTGKTTSLLSADGARASDLVLGSTSPAYAALAAGHKFLGPLEISGRSYFGALQPIETMKGEVLGALFVGDRMDLVQAAATETLGLILVVGLIVTIVLGVVGFVLSRLISRPIPQIESAMHAIASGQFDLSVPYAQQRNEVGGMARAVEVFRQNGLKVTQMTEAEAARIIADRQSRQQMMAQLQAAFGNVVHAAVGGDFSKRVDIEFPDPELNALAAGVNELVSSFDRGLAEIADVLGAMAQADLTRRVRGQYAGALATLKSDANAVAEKFSEVVGRLRYTSRSLKAATGEILSGANDLSERTTRQAATIEETSATMEQLASTVMQNADRSKSASDVANTLTRTAEEGGEVMHQATDAMLRITESSSKISNIIGLIDDIAFQTNLLALNASVEAARAGDAGKGFAVVAVEVRRLAQSAAKASSDVKSLIEQSAVEVRIGSKLVEGAATRLHAMVVAARSSNDVMSSIARESDEQATAIEGINSAVRSMDETTQHNAALVEEINAAIEQTEGQATQLDNVIEVFRLDRPASSPEPAMVKNAGRHSETLRRPVRSYLSEGNAA